MFKCPWCGTSLKGEKHGSTQKNLGYKAGRNNSIAFICPELRCNFSKRNNPFPISVIDEDIYSEPPSLIIGTVDKFAILAWREDAGVIFGRGDVNCSPPDLIIQDELHLISGPVGTMVGLYESAIDQLCTDENGIGSWLHSGEFVKLEDYEKALRMIIELEELLKLMTIDQVKH